ncbi:MAG: SapC family protein [Sphingomicrobium sp.]
MSNHVILDSEAHRDLRIRAGATAALGDGVMACLTVPTEFRRVQNEFPILFRRDMERGAFSSLALFGFENGENLFVEADSWDARYRPLALSIPPFLIGQAADGQAQVHLDMGHPRIASEGDEGIRAFDEHGRPTPYLEAVFAGLDELDQGYRASGEFFAALERYDLLEPFSLDIDLRDGSTHRLVGYHLIDEGRLQALEPGAVADLHEAGHLMPAFMAIASLSNISALVARKNRRLGSG